MVFPSYRARHLKLHLNDWKLPQLLVDQVRASISSPARLAPLEARLPCTSSGILLALELLPKFLQGPASVTFGCQDALGLLQVKKLFRFFVPHSLLRRQHGCVVAEHLTAFVSNLGGFLHSLEQILQWTVGG